MRSSTKNLTSFRSGSVNALTIFFVVFGIVAFLSVMDVQGFSMISKIGGYGGETYQKIDSLYMKFFWTFAAGIGITAMIVYYLLRNDLSETIAIGAGYLLLIASGLEDVIYYFFLGTPIDTTLPWLSTKPFISAIAGIVGSDIITKNVLLISTVIGLVMTYYLIKFLSAKKFLGVKS